MEQTTFGDEASTGSEISLFDEIALRHVLSLFGRTDLKILEIGSWLGRGSTQVLQRYSNLLLCLDSSRENKIYSHDVVIEGVDPHVLSTTNTSSFSNKTIAIRGLSSMVLPLLAPSSFDVIFVDGSRLYNNVKDDIESALPLLKPGGTLIGHDCELDINKADKFLYDFVKKNSHLDAVESRLENFRHMHCGVICALGDFDFNKLFFCNIPLNCKTATGVDVAGFSSIWVASQSSLIDGRVPLVLPEAIVQSEDADAELAEKNAHGYNIARSDRRCSNIPVINIVVGNHQSIIGIIEVIYSVYSALQDRFVVKVSQYLVENQVNIIIDEFTSPIFHEMIAGMKKRFPRTKVVVVATEFVTPISILGYKVMNTFNFFGSPHDWIFFIFTFLKSLTNKAHRSYMHMRYLGFIKAMDICDELACIHPGILSALNASQATPKPCRAFLIYPTIKKPLHLRSLRTLAASFTVTGSITPFRRRIISRINRLCRDIFHLPPIITIKEFKNEMSLTELASLEEGVEANVFLDRIYSAAETETLYNLNPPQGRNWKYSSPMRILRAVLIGQIPVITEKCNDHPLEEVALLCNINKENNGDLYELIQYRYMSRERQIEKYCHSLASYNDFSRDANEPFCSMIYALWSDSNQG